MIRNSFRYGIFVHKRYLCLKEEEKINSLADIYTQTYLLALRKRNKSLPVNEEDSLRIVLYNPM